jgi:hypothetical protein
VADLSARPDAPASLPTREPLYGAAADHVRDQLREPSITPGAIPPAVTNLLAAIVEALDVPLADQPGDDTTAAALMRQRANEARIIAASVLRDLDPRNIEGAAQQLRGWTAECPVTYRSWQQRTEQAAAEEEQLLDAEPVAESGLPGKTPFTLPDEAETATRSAVAAFLAKDGEGR